MLIDCELCCALADVHVPAAANYNTSGLYSLIGNRWVYVPTRFTSSVVRLRSALQRREKIRDCGLEVFILKRPVSAHLTTVCFNTAEVSDALVFAETSLYYRRRRIWDPEKYTSCYKKLFRVSNQCASHF